MLEAGETTLLLKTADMIMNQNKSAKGDRAGKMAPLSPDPSVKC